MLTKELAKEGRKAVPIGILYKFIKTVDEGNWNRSKITCLFQTCPLGSKPAPTKRYA